MRTFLIALVCSIAAFVGGSAYMFNRILNDTGPPLFSPGSAYLSWSASKGAVVGSPDSPVRTDQSIRDVAGMNFFTQTQVLTAVFDKLTAQQVNNVNRYLPFLRTSVPAQYRPATDILVDCISNAKVGDDISECNVTVARAYLAARQPLAAVGLSN